MRGPYSRPSRTLDGERERKRERDRYRDREIEREGEKESEINSASREENDASGGAEVIIDRNA